ncbi:FKBP-type peptidyl-prolyl cis-trans isomerase [Mariniblastus fucicola]|nr:FKBP-type peptidyl-prolyl cis-trans isomerase [Mariniblastus fucicola]
MSLKFNVLFSVLCLAATVTPFSIATAQESGAVPGITPSVVATEMSEEEMMKKASIILIYNRLGQMLVQLKADGIELDQEAAMEGARRALAGEPIGVSLDDARSIMGQLQKKAEQSRIEKVKAAAAKNKAEGDAYLAENAKKEGVKSMDNGVQYEVMVEGDGPKPKPTDTVKINYHGTFIDGKVFDSTLVPSQGQPAKPYVANASVFVDGFNAALQSMPVGSKWKIAIPGEQAYGLEGRGPIGPNQTIVFELELLEIVKADEVAPSQNQ